MCRRTDQTHPATVKYAAELCLLFTKAWSRAWTWKGGEISIPPAKAVCLTHSYRLYRGITLLSALRKIWRTCLRTKLLEAHQYDWLRLLWAGPRGKCMPDCLIGVATERRRVRGGGCFASVMWRFVSCCAYFDVLKAFEDQCCIVIVSRLLLKSLGASVFI